MNHANKPAGLDLDKVSRILVYAFGAFDRYYICWKDKAGDFHQDGHNLPKTLQDWLFPVGGQTRDFETLQVTLLHNDEFCAFDKNDKITDFRSARDTTHRRSAPETMMIKDSNFTHSQADPPTLVRRQTYAASNVGRPVSRRTRSLVSAPSARRWSLNTAAGRMLPTVPSASPATPSGAAADVSPSPVTASRYTDASVQTEVTRSPCKNEFLPRKVMSTGESELESATAVYHYPCSEMDTSNAKPGTRARQNPFRIGSMAMYFRKPGYRLGDALLSGTGGV